MLDAQKYICSDAGLPYVGGCSSSAVKIIVQSPAFLTALNAVMTNTTRMMNYIKWRALMRYGAYMGDDFLKQQLEFDKVCRL